MALTKRQTDASHAIFDVLTRVLRTLCSTHPPLPHGILTGTQARGFFTKTGLPMPVLGQIWNLADEDKDGQMTLEEFAVAMFLISAKLKGKDLPAVLPASLKPATTVCMSCRGATCWSSTAALHPSKSDIG